MLMFQVSKAEVTLDVLYGPEVSVPKSKKVEAGEDMIAFGGKSMSLVGGAKPLGYPIPTYRWWKEGSESSILATGATFTLDSASLASAGKYYCQPQNEFG